MANGGDVDSYKCFVLKEDEWVPMTVSISLDGRKLYFADAADDDIDIRYILKNPSCIDSELTSLQISYVCNGEYKRVFLRLDDYYHFNKKQPEQYILKGLLNCGFVYDPLTKRDIWAEMDEEIFAVFDKPTSVNPSSVFFFYKEAVPNVVNSIQCLDNKVLKIHHSEPVECFMIHVKEDSQWQHAIQKVRPLSVHQFPYQHLRQTALRLTAEVLEESTKQLYAPENRKHEYVTEEDAPENRKHEYVTEEDREKIQDSSDRYNSDMVRFNEMRFSGCDDMELDGDLAVMWVVAESELNRIKEEGLVPGSSIASGGLDPDSWEHFDKCIMEISDELFNQNYDLAYSHFRGSKELFAESAIPYLFNFFKEDPIKMLKKIYFLKAS